MRKCPSRAKNPTPANHSALPNRRGICGMTPITFCPRFRRFVKKSPNPRDSKRTEKTRRGEPTGSAVEQRENGNADHPGQGSKYSSNSWISFESHQPFVCGTSYMPLQSWHVALGRRTCARSSLRGLCAFGASVVCPRFFTRFLDLIQAGATRRAFKTGGSV